MRRAGWFLPRENKSGHWLILASGGVQTPMRALGSGGTGIVFFREQAFADEFLAEIGSERTDVNIRVGEFDASDFETGQFNGVLVDDLADHRAPVAVLDAVLPLVGNSGRLGLSVSLLRGASLASIVLAELRRDYAPVRIDVSGVEFFAGFERSTDAAARWQDFDERDRAFVMRRLVECELYGGVEGRVRHASADQNSELVALKEEMAAQQQEMKRLEAEAAAFATLRSRLGDAVDASALTNALLSGVAEVGDLVKSLEQSREQASGSGTSVYKELLNARSQLSIAQAERTALGKLVEELKTDLIGAEQERAGLQIELSDQRLAKQSAGTADAALRSQLDQALADKADTEQELADAAAQHDALKVQLDALRADLAAEQARLKQGESDASNLNAKLEQTRAAQQQAEQQHRDAKTRIAGLQSELGETKARLDQAKKLEEERRKEVAAKDAELHRIEQSLRYRVGSRIVRTVKGTLAAFGLKAFREGPDLGTENQKATSQAEPALIDVALPTQQASGKITLGIIADEFTTSCFAPDVNLLRLDIKNFADEIRAQKPDMILVESAWAGNDNNWQYRIAKYNRNMGDELAEMVEIADAEGVPTVFWNKEDPVHFERFVHSARKCDVILTTDEQCVPRYVSETGKNRVHAMPFAAQPEIHNPLSDEPRLNNPCFAGTYYGSRHQQRGADMLHLLKPAIDFGLHIYDRRYGYAGKDADQFRFPDPYQPCIQGKLPYTEMTRAYKRYRSFLNVNSVTTSKTMFSRRVFELLASGTPVISSYSAGIEDMLGDVVFISQSEEDTRAALEKLSDDDYWARASMAGMRKVFAEHTYQHRLEYMADKADISLTQSLRPADRFIIASMLKGKSDIERLVQHVNVQRTKPTLILLLAGEALSAEETAALGKAGGDCEVRVLPDDTDMNRLAASVNEHAGAYLVRMDASRGYGAYYLADMQDALRYTRPHYFGRHTHFVTDDQHVANLNNPGWEYRHVTGAPGASAAVKCGDLTGAELRSLLHKQWLRVDSERRLVGLTRFGFVDHTIDQGAVVLNEPTVRAALELG